MRDIWISLRNSVLDALSGQTAAQILNDPPAGNLPVDRYASDGDPAASLYRMARGMLSVAATAGGRGVDYARLRESPAYVDYRRATAALVDFDPASLPTRQAQQAFWINLYNALIIDSVLTLNVKRSVTEGRLGILSFFRRTAYRVGALVVSADDIEHGILRGNRGHPYLPGAHFRSDDPRCKWIIDPVDPRIHFALNCASVSCPPIRFYAAHELDAQLDLAARNYINATTRCSSGSNTLEISTLFRWYRMDFGSKADILAFVERYLAGESACCPVLRHGDAVKLTFGSYNWALNIAGAA
ncbi:MAG: DUF547 domain-containing protein [Anaerolineae bacterium]